MFTYVYNKYTGVSEMSEHAATKEAELSRPGLEIETLLLANHAESINGMLYVMGGGWTTHWRDISDPKQVPTSHFGIAVAVKVPWTETNRRHHLTLRIESEDRPDDPLVEIDGDLTMGRPPDLPRGADQRATLAVNANVQFPEEGGYCVKAQLSSGHVRTVSFQVKDRHR